MESVGVVHPLLGPVGLDLNDVDVLDRIKKIMFLVRILDVGVNQQRVGL